MVASRARCEAVRAAQHRGDGARLTAGRQAQLPRAPATWRHSDARCHHAASRASRSRPLIATALVVGCGSPAPSPTTTPAVPGEPSSPDPNGQPSAAPGVPPAPSPPLDQPRRGARRGRLVRHRRRRGSAGRDPGAAERGGRGGRARTPSSGCGAWTGGDPAQLARALVAEPPIDVRRRVGVGRHRDHPTAGRPRTGDHVPDRPHSLRRDDGGAAGSRRQPVPLDGHRLGPGRRCHACPAWTRRSRSPSTSSA